MGTIFDGAKWAQSRVRSANGTKAERRIERERRESRVRSWGEQCLRSERGTKRMIREDTRACAVRVGAFREPIFSRFDREGKDLGPAVDVHSIPVRTSDPTYPGGPRPQRYPCGARALMRRQGILVVPKGTSLAPHWAAMGAPA